MLFAVVICFLLPITLLFWIANVFIYSFNSGQNVWEPISPWRWILAIALPAFIANHGLRRKSLSRSGAQAGFFVGIIMTLSNYCFMAALLTFFLLGSRITKWRSNRKRKLDEDFKEGGQRNWLQVICNAGVAAEFALIYMIDAGCSQYPFDFQRRYAASWLSSAVLGALACSCGDTFASEIGSVVGKSDPWLLTSFQRVPKGTNGGISIVGLLSSFIGGLLVGVMYFLILHLCIDEHVMSNSLPQWPIILLGGLCGFFGSLIDSFLGATLQFSGLDTETGCIVQLPGDNVRHISGIPLFDNHGVNLISSLFTALLAPQFALHIWSHFIPTR